ncbi:MAG: hypothetical protein WC564_05520 [Patescibacteria group bacterium]
MDEDQIVKKIENVGSPEQTSVVQPEAEISPEKVAEQKVERVAPKVEEVVLTPQPSGVTANRVAPAKTAEQIRNEQIDAILSDGLADIYLNLSPQKQVEFRTSGEEAVKKINGLLSQTKVKIRQIVDIIKRWLTIIPGLNKFFLEQEAKIKADKIIKLKK